MRFACFALDVGGVDGAAGALESDSKFIIAMGFVSRTGRCEDYQ